MGSSFKVGHVVVEKRVADAARGDSFACYDLGVAYSTGTAGVAFDLIEAHKWFNLAAVAGNAAAQEARADIAGEMTARQISAAQAAARAWMGRTRVQAI